MYLPPSNPEAPLTPLVDKVVFFVNKQASTVGPSSPQPSPAKASLLTESVLKLGVGIGSVFNAFYGTPALAASFPEDLKKSNTQPTSTDLGLQLSHQESSTSASIAQAILPWEMTTSLLRSQDRRTALSLQPAPSLADMGELTRLLTQPQPLTGNHQARLLAVQGNYYPKFSAQTAPATAKRASQPKAQSKLSPIESVTRTALIRSEEAANLLHPDSNHDLLDIATLAPELSTLTAIGDSASGNSLSTGYQAQNTLEPNTLEPTLPSQAPLSQESDASIETLEKEAFITIEEVSLKDQPPSQATSLGAIPEATPSEEEQTDAAVLKPVLKNTPLQSRALAADAAVPSTALKNETDSTLAQAQDEETSDPLSERLERLQREAQAEESGELDDELGTLRIQQTRGRANEELGVLRLLQTAQAPPPPPKPPISFLTGRLGFFSSENAFRSNPRLSETINQAGLAYYLFPKLSDRTSLYAIAETNLARYGNFGTVDYNELEVQLGIRQRLLPRTFAQIGWRNQRLYSPGYRERLFSVHYIDTLISHRSILNRKTWVDGFYQARLGFADPESASRFRQTFTVSLNYGVTRDFRTSLLYQLDLDDYTQVSRHDTYQQLLGVISYNLTPESRVSLFGGTRFGRSSSPGVNLNDTFYGAGLNVSVPLF